MLIGGVLQRVSAAPDKPGMQKNILEILEFSWMSNVLPENPHIN